MKGAWLEIAKNFPHRSVQSVYRHGLRVLHPFRRGAWSEEELNKLFELVARLGKKWVAVQNILRRSADCCRDKYRECSADFVKGRWKEHEMEELKQLILDYLKWPDRKANMIDIGKMVEAEGSVLPWTTFSKKMGTRSRLSCFKKFQKMAGLFVPPTASEGRERKKKSRVAKEQEEPPALDLGDITGDVDMYLLSELAQSGANRASEIPWDTLRGTEAAQERWNMLVMEWQQQEGGEATEEALTTLPFCELAQLLLDRKTSAKIAAETVEAIDLPVV